MSLTFKKGNPIDNAAKPLMLQCEGPSRHFGNEPLKIWILDIMPEKKRTDSDFIRMLDVSGIDVELTFLCIPGQTYKTTPQSYIDQYYTPFDEVAKASECDGLIITGAPVEHLEFEEVRYWKQLCEIMDWSVNHAKSTLHICWGAQAGLYHHFSIGKTMLCQKMFGIYKQRISDKSCKLFDGMGKELFMPVSRHTQACEDKIYSSPQLETLAANSKSGIGIVSHGKQIFVMGHLEYAADTLDREYKRDLDKGLDIHAPVNYYVGNDIDFTWANDAALFYSNWLKYYCR